MQVKINGKFLSSHTVITKKGQDMTIAKILIDDEILNVLNYEKSHNILDDVNLVVDISIFNNKISAFYNKDNQSL